MKKKMAKLLVIALSVNLACAAAIPVFADEGTVYAEQGLEDPVAVSDEDGPEEVILSDEEEITSDSSDVEGEPAYSEEAEKNKETFLEGAEEAKKVLSEEIEETKVTEEAETVSDIEKDPQVEESNISETEEIEEINEIPDTEEPGDPNRNNLLEDSTGYTIKDGVLTITGSGPMPEEPRIKPWRELKDSITKIVISDGITSIADYAFYGCNNLHEIVIPDSVKRIGEGAFRFSSLYDLKIPKNVSEIGEMAFTGGEDHIITSITVHPDNKYYDSRNNCNALIETASNKLICGFEKTVIPDTVTSIDHEAFRGCADLKSIVIPDSVTSMGVFVFAECPALEKISLSKNLTEVRNGVFRNCTSLKEIVIPEGVEHFGKNTFFKCSALTKIYLPLSLKNLGTSFEQCTALKDVYYAGTEEDWKNINTNGEYGYNKYLLNANIHYSYGKKKAVKPVITLSAKTYTYNGKVKTPKVTVKADGKELPASDYDVSYPTGRKKAGNYKITVTLKGNYEGTGTATFKIVKAKNSIKKIPSSKKLTFSYLRPKNQTFKLSASAREKAKTTYKMVSVPARAKKYISVSKTGNVKVKKGLKKGTYKIKVKITAAATANYKKTSVTRTIKIVVRKKAKPSYKTLKSLGLYGYSSTLDAKLNKHLNTLAGLGEDHGEDLFKISDLAKAFQVSVYIGSKFYYKSGSYSAESMIDTGYGTCMAYSDLTYCMLKKLGINDCWLTVPGRNVGHGGKWYGSQHRSVVMKTGSDYYEVDSNLSYMMIATGMTDSKALMPEKITKSYADYLCGRANSYTKIN